MGLPWKNNEKLIQDLYEQIQALKEEVNTLSKHIEFSTTLEKAKDTIASEILRGITSDLPEKIAELAIQKIKQMHQGIV